MKPTSVKFSKDGLRVDLRFAELLPKKIYEFRVDALKTEEGKPLEHPLAFYTLNRRVK